MSKKLFISHKISEHGRAVDMLKTILNRFVPPDQLEIITSMPIGEDLVEKIKKNLDDTALFLLMANYSSPPEKNEWCSYELGYFDSISSRTNGSNKKIISLVKEGSEPPDPIKNRKFVMETRDGIRELLEEIFKDLRDDLLTDSKHEENIEKTITEILEVLKPATVITELAPRVWITIKKEKFDAFKNGKIPLPIDSIVTGETEMFTKNKVKFLDGEDFTLEKIDQLVDYPFSLPPFYAILEDVLQEILKAPRHGPWQMPPLRTMKDTSPRIIVPAALEKDVEGNYRFEFFVTEPPPYNVPGVNPKFMSLYNLFIISWHFRWRVIEKHLNELVRMESYSNRNEGLDKNRKKQLQKLIKTLKLDIEAIYLDSYNRDIESQVDVTDHFDDIDKEIMENIVDSKRGLWEKIKPKFDEALENEKISDIIMCLKAWRDLNKTVLILTLKKLEELAKDKDVIKGNFISDETTCRNILESFNLT